ncbi:hypothetical protein C8R43DRAFT_674967 [Mycena crocata]|nr:hypothetical protein C8R43DRAFT_674967 [Mycena crocata]
MHAQWEGIVSPPPPWHTYLGLIAAINGLQLSKLTTLELSIDALYFEDRASDADFSPLLRLLPSLKELTLHATGLTMPLPPDVVVHLSRLRIFTGSLAHCAVLAAHATELAHLSMLYPNKDTPENLPARLFSPAVAPTVTRLDIRAVDQDGSFSRYFQQLSTVSLGGLAAAFPNIVHLEVTLAEEMKHYTSSFVALPRLEYIRLRWFIHIPTRNWNLSAGTVFPPGDYAGYISAELVPYLPLLTEVRLVLRGARDNPNPHCSSCGTWEPEHLLATYGFSVGHIDDLR